MPHVYVVTRLTAVLVAIELLVFKGSPWIHAWVSEHIMCDWLGISYWSWRLTWLYVITQFTHLVV